MVQIEKTGFLSDIRNQSTYRTFPSAEFDEIRAAIEDIPAKTFQETEHGQEIRKLDELIAAGLFEHEHYGTGRNPRCKLWANNGFNHSVDLYHPEKRIAIEIEKSERKRVSDDILKFIKGGKTQRNKRKKIEFGCLIVPVNYRGSGNIFAGALNTLDFMRSVLFVEDVAVIGYRDPRWIV